MPPLAVDRFKTVADHHALKPHPVFILLRRNPLIVRMGYLTEEIEGAPHIQFFPGRHVQKRQIDRTSSAVTRLAGNISLREQFLLFQFRIKIWLHADVLVFDSPQHKMPDRTPGPISIEDLQPIALHQHLTADGFQCSGSLYGKQGAGLLITVNALADKIVGGIIPDFLHNMRNEICQYYKSRRIQFFILIVFSHAFSPNRL